MFSEPNPVRKGLLGSLFSSRGDDSSTFSSRIGTILFFAASSSAFCSFISSKSSEESKLGFLISGGSSGSGRKRGFFCSSFSLDFVLDRFGLGILGSGRASGVVKSRPYLGFYFKQGLNSCPGTLLAAKSGLSSTTFACEG